MPPTTTATERQLRHRRAIARRLRQCREARGLSLRRLAVRAVVAWTTINRIECCHADPTLVVLTKLARGLGCDVRDLLPEPRRRATQRGSR